MNENDLRDCFAMFALVGLAGHIVDGMVNPVKCYEIADAMIEARNKEPEQEIGIVAVKSRRKTK